MSNQKGFAHHVLPIVIILVAVIGFAGWRVMSARQHKSVDESQTNNPAAYQGSNVTTKPSTTPAPVEYVSWQFNDTEWTANGVPPNCPDPVTLKMPVDLSKVTSILYPGQTRGGDYKPHGGFRFDTASSNDVTVKAPLDAYAVHGSRYLEQGEVQYLIFFVNPCGIAYRYDHLLTLSPDMQKLIDETPEAKADDSRTTNFTKPFAVKAGDVIATAVGHKVNNNVGFDLGVYDLRKPNDASKSAAFATAHANLKSQANYAVCWLDWFGSDSAKVRALPAGDQKAGKKSDYCK